MNENKIPCGGFRIGDGLTMDGDTLKSLGGAYIKVSTNDGQTFEFADDSPLKTFEEIEQTTKTSAVTLLMFPPDSVSSGVRSYFFDGYTSGEINLINFYTLGVMENRLIVGKISIDSNNKITQSAYSYTLTPAT